MGDPGPPPKDELILRIERSWDVLVQTFESTQDAALEQPGPDGGWSAKDHLAHLAAWEGKALAVLEGREAYEGLGIDEANYRTRDVDGINELLSERFADTPAADVVEDLRNGHATLMAAVAAASDEDLARPAYSSSGEERRVADDVRIETYEHYDEHLPLIEQLLGSRK